MFLVKQVSSKITLSMGCLYDIHFISGLNNASNLHNFCIIVKWIRTCWTLCGLMEFLIFDFEGHSKNYMLFLGHIGRGGHLRQNFLPSGAPTFFEAQWTLLSRGLCPENQIRCVLSITRNFKKKKIFMKIHFKKYLWFIFCEFIHLHTHFFAKL